MNWAVLFGAMLLQGEAQNLAPPVIDVNRAIDRGIENLRRHQGTDGRWSFNEYALGATALVGLSFLENGVSPADPAIQSAYRFVKSQAATNNRTYEIGLAIVFLGRFGAREDWPLILRLANRLLLGQQRDGGWVYFCPLDESAEQRREVPRDLPRGDGDSDNSNTQFAVLGLWAASRYGAAIDAALELVNQRFRTSQTGAGGWGYRRRDGEAEPGSMTAAGLYCLAVVAADAARRGGKSGQTTTPAPAVADALAQDAAFQKGLERVSHYASRAGDRSVPYFLWSIERLGVTLRVRKFGVTDWYAVAARSLLASQRPDGSWTHNFGAVPDTALALLVLRKANLGRDMYHLLTGDPTKPFVLIARDVERAFETLDAAVAASQAGNVIEIRGYGPYPVAGVAIRHPLSIRSGDGFDATLAFPAAPTDVGNPDMGSRMLVVRGGRLIVEGVRMQVDPSPQQPGPISAVVVESGEFRAVNCTFSQSNGPPASAITLQKDSVVALRNCALIGFASAIHSLDAGKQSLDLTNCLVHGVIGLQAAGKSAGSCDVRWLRNSFDVVEVVHLAEMPGRISFIAEHNVLRARAFSAQTMVPNAAAARTWQGLTNVFDLQTWLAATDRPAVGDLVSWRQRWKSAEIESETAAAGFAVGHAHEEYRHDANPTDWRRAESAEARDSTAMPTFGCDTFLTGAGQAYPRFKGSIAYDAWRGCLPTSGHRAVSGTAP